MARASALLLLLLALAGCGGGERAGEPADATPQPATTAEQGPTAQAATEPAAPEALPGLPPELAGYDGWTRVNDAPIPPRAADPHDGTKNVYASVGPGADGAYPEGAIVVKEAVRPGADFVGLIAMMRKEKGAQPDHNDWVWVEWTRDSPDTEFAEIARGAVCYSCHVGARESDYVFTR